MNHQMECHIKFPSNILLAMIPTLSQPYMLRNNFYKIRCPFDSHRYDNLVHLLLPEHQFCIVQFEALNCNIFPTRKNMSTSTHFELQASYILCNYCAVQHASRQLYNTSIVHRGIWLCEQIFEFIII